MNSEENDENDMRRRFDEAIEAMLASKRADNKAFLSIVEYNNRINDVKNSKLKLRTAKSNKTTKDYRLVKKYDVLIIHGKEKLIKPVDDTTQTVLYYVTNEELFDILNLTHVALGHGGRNRMVRELKYKYCNITKEAVMLYLRLCVVCHKKLTTKKKELLSKPIPDIVVNSKAQIDIINMQNYNDYNFILVYKDHLTKFVVLKPLKTTAANEIALNLLDIYMTFGAPAILQSADRDLVISVLKEVHDMWNGVKIVHGKASEDTVEICRDIKVMLTNWMEVNKSKDWTIALKFVQFQRNRSVHSSTGRSPYEVMFGCQPKIGLLSIGLLPLENIALPHSEEDIQALIKVPKEELISNDSEEDTETDKSMNAAYLCKVIENNN